MKVLIVNSSDFNGGAAKAAYRLYEALNSSDIDCSMLVVEKLLSEKKIIGGFKGFKRGIALFKSFADGWFLNFYPGKSKTYFSPSFFGLKDVIQLINQVNPDVVHLHWICDGMIKIEDIKKIKAPIVWSLHDMWPFTGGCHYNEDCTFFEDNCGKCKVLGSKRTSDLSSKIQSRKLKTYSKIESLTPIGLSKWISTEARKSKLFKERSVINLPNTIDTNLFKPLNKTAVRSIWNLPVDKKLVLFGAMDSTADPRKGFNELNSAINKIINDEVEFVILGGNSNVNYHLGNSKSHFISTLRDDVSLVALYSAVDVIVVPSIQENLSNVIMESLSCGVPVVAFDIGGNGDMIDHLKNGYLAKPYDTSDLANGIMWVLNHELNDSLSYNARSKVVECYDYKKVSIDYIKLYKTVLESNEKYD